jgi:hypothetical protein
VAFLPPQGERNGCYKRQVHDLDVGNIAVFSGQDAVGIDQSFPPSKGYWIFCHDPFGSGLSCAGGTDLVYNSACCNALD